MIPTGKYVCCFGEILWDVLPSGKQPGGAPMNVGFHLKNLGLEVAMISRVGADELGREIKSYVSNKNCSVEWIQSDPHYPTGRVLVDVSNKNEVTYEILQPVAWDFIEATSEAITIASGAAVFVYGSLACRNNSSRKALMTLLESTNAVKVCDVNFRKPHFTKQLIDDLLRSADVVKMNQDELGIIKSWHQVDGTLAQVAEQLKSKFGLKILIVTLGADGALLVDSTGAHRSKIYRVQVKDTIGSGDSFLAGVIKNLLLKKPADETVNYACALGALVAQHHGANPVITEGEILELMRK
jgi:fructokinase